VPAPSAKRRFAFALTASALALAVIEGAAHLLPESLIAHRAAFERSAIGPQEMVASDTVPGWDLDPKGGMLDQTSYVANKWRMRGPYYPDEKATNARRVIFVGDSSVFGVRLTWSQTFAAGFEKLREDSNPGVDYQVANCASPGHTTYQSIYKLKGDCLAFMPDLVVIANQNSDGTLTEVPDHIRFRRSTADRAKDFADNFALFRLARNSMSGGSAKTADAEKIPQVGMAPSGDTQRVPAANYEQNLRTMVALVRASGATPAFLMLPRSNDLNPNDQGTVTHRNAMRQVALDEKVVLADGPNWFLNAGYSANQVFIDPVHPSAEGSKLLATLLDKTMPQI
jgi:lysophospholipase L1-like esterase